MKHLKFLIRAMITLLLISISKNNVYAAESFPTTANHSVSSTVGIYNQYPDSLKSAVYDFSEISKIKFNIGVSNCGTTYYAGTLILKDSETGKELASEKVESSTGTTFYPWGVGEYNYSNNVLPNPGTYPCSLSLSHLTPEARKECYLLFSPTYGFNVNNDGGALFSVWTTAKKGAPYIISLTASPTSIDSTQTSTITCTASSSVTAYTWTVDEQPAGTTTSNVFTFGANIIKSLGLDMTKSTHKIGCVVSSDTGSSEASTITLNTDFLPKIWSSNPSGNLTRPCAYIVFV